MVLNNLAKPILILDAYLDDWGGASNIRKLLGERLHEVIRLRDVSALPEPDHFSGIIITGSIASMLEPPAWVKSLDKIIQQSAKKHIPVLGICFGHQAIAHALAKLPIVRKSPTPELGWIEITRNTADPLLEVLPEQFMVFVSHTDEVVRDDNLFRISAHSQSCSNHAFKIHDLPIWGIQFHPEMDLEEATDLVQKRRSPQEAKILIARSTLQLPDLGNKIMDRFVEIIQKNSTRI